MKATPEMIAAGAEAARKYMEETGGNNPAVIWDAMYAAQPKEPEQEPVAEIEFLDWVHPNLGVTKVEVEGGKPLVLKAKIKLPTPKKCTNCASLEDELERAKIKSAVWKSAYDVERGYNEQDTTPPQRKPLTDEEYSALAEQYTGADGLDCVDYGRAIARHYGIKE